MNNLSLLENKLEEILTLGANTLKVEYFNFAIDLEKQAKNIGISSVHFFRDLMILNNRPMHENVTIRKQDLINVYPEIKVDEALKLFADYNTIYKSSFFERMKENYKVRLNLMFDGNEAKFQHDDLTMEFKIYKLPLKKEELEKELSNRNQEMKDKKLKI